MNRNKVIGFWEEVAPTLEDDEFRHYFTKCRCYQGGCEQVIGRKAVVMTDGCQLPFKQLSGFFGISECCLMEVLNEVMGLLLEKSKVLIKWADKEDFPAIAAEFNKKHYW